MTSEIKLTSAPSDENLSLPLTDKENSKGERLNARVLSVFHMTIMAIIVIIGWAFFLVGIGGLAGNLLHLQVMTTELTSLGLPGSISLLVTGAITVGIFIAS